MKKSNFFFLILSLFITSCATTHPGRLGAPTGPTELPLKISAQTIDSKKGSAFQLIELTLENTSDDWLKVNSSQVLINNPADSKLSVVLGKDLVAWAEAMQFQKDQDNYNSNILQAGLAGLGTVAMVAGAANNDKNLVTAGALLAVGSLGWAASDVIKNSQKKAQGVSKYPENHFYEPVSIPGKMFVRRWVLINKPSAVMISKIAVQIENVTGARGIYEIPL